MENVIKKQCGQLAKQLKTKNVKAQTITVKVKFANFKQITRSFTNPVLLNNANKIFQISQFLLKRAEINQQKVRLLGVSLSQIKDENQMAHPVQLSLFD